LRDNNLHFYSLFLLKEANCPNLKELDLSGNKLAWFPKDIFKNLKKLYVSYLKKRNHYKVLELFKNHGWINEGGEEMDLAKVQKGNSDYRFKRP